MSRSQFTTHRPGDPLPAFRVREATPQDNAALLALERECVVAAATPVAFDRSPDFFARSRPYSTWRAYVAEGDSGLIGVGALALKSVLVGGRPVQAAYFYDLRVAPGFRRLGVAKAVGDAIRAYTRSLTLTVGYSLVMEGNVASLCRWDFAERQVGPKRCGWPRRFFGENRDQGQPVSWQCRTTSRIPRTRGWTNFGPSGSASRCSAWNWAGRVAPPSAADRCSWTRLTFEPQGFLNSRTPEQLNCRTLFSG